MLCLIGYIRVYRLKCLKSLRKTYLRYSEALITVWSYCDDSVYLFFNSISSVAMATRLVVTIATICVFPLVYGTDLGEDVDSLQASLANYTHDGLFFDGE